MIILKCCTVRIRKLGSSYCLICLWHLLTLEISDTFNDCSWYSASNTEWTVRGLNTGGAKRIFYSERHSDRIRGWAGILSSWKQRFIICGKAARAWNWQVTFILCQSYETMELNLHSLCMQSQNVQKHPTSLRIHLMASPVMLICRSDPLHSLFCW